MSILERQTDFSRTLFEINQNTFQELSQSTQENIVKYFELNSEFSQKLPDVSDVTTFMELQREYGETFWSNVREATRSQAGILKSAVEETGTALRKVFATES